MKITEIINENWSQKYKSSINCSHPKGFSQRAHCAGKKKHTESVDMEMVCESCGMCQTHGNLNEIAKGAKDSNGFTKCWPGKHAEGTKKGRNGGQVRNCVPNESQGVAEGLDDDPYDQGFSDGYNGNRKRNPFPLRSKEHKEYDEGWFEGRLDYQKMNRDLDEGVAEGKINPAGLNHTQQIGDYVYRAKALTGSDEGEIEMTAYDGKKSIADTVFMPYGSGGRMVSGQTYVHPAYRGKGVAAGMYAYLRMLGFKIEPSGLRTGAGKAMWDKWEKAGDAKHLSKGMAEGGEKYKVKSIGTDKDGDYYISPSTGKKVYKSGVKVGDHENPKTGEHKGVAEDWNKVNHHDKTNGLSQKAVNAYRREHPGSKLKTAVTTKPSKLKPGSKAAKRRKSFCARMGGNKGPMKKPNGKPTPKALALRRWNCESIEEMQQLIMLGEQYIANLKEDGSAGGTSSGSIASVSMPLGGKKKKKGGGVNLLGGPVFKR
jgi:GNAT superfamily N-acetyltransferase